MMKVALLCRDIGCGGIQSVVVTLGNQLVRKGLSVDLIVLRGGGKFLCKLSPEVNVIDLGCTSQPLGLLFPSSTFAAYFKKGKPDTVISFGNSTNNLAAWAKLLLGLSFRLFVSEHSTFGARMICDSAFHRWRRTVRSRFLYKQADLCVCVSQGVADDLAALSIVPEEKLRVIYNPISGSHLTELADFPVRHPWLQPGQPPVILSVGRLMRLKGLDDLLKAFEILRRKWNANARLMLLGEGPDRARLEKMAETLGIADAVFFAGYQENPYAYMAKASLLALTSHYEGFGNVLAEALACGTNVVSTDCKSGPREILENGKWGRLVPVGDFEALAEAMRDALAAPLPAEKLKARAAYFSIERAVEGYMNILRTPARRNFLKTSEVTR